MNASFFTIASLSLKMAEIATSGWSTLADIENSYFKGGYKKSYWGTLFDHRQMLFKNSINKTERLYPFKIKNIKILPFCIIAMDVMSFYFSIFPLVWFCCVRFLSACAKNKITISWGKISLGLLWWLKNIMLTNTEVLSRRLCIYSFKSIQMVAGSGIHWFIVFWLVRRTMVERQFPTIPTHPGIRVHFCWWLIERQSWRVVVVCHTF